MGERLLVYTKNLELARLIVFANTFCNSCRDLLTSRASTARHLGYCTPAENHAILTAVPLPHSSINLSAAIEREFESAVRINLDGGVPLTDLLHRINRVAMEFLPEDDGRIGRAKRLFTPRSFRHYQTFGCIDPPERRGNRVFYRFHHFVQAVLVRSLLWERMPAERIASLMVGRDTEELKRMFFAGTEMVVRGGVAERVSPLESVMSSAPGAAETWKHIGVAPGIALLLHSELTKPRPGEVREWLARIETALRRNL